MRGRMHAPKHAKLTGAELPGNPVANKETLTSHRHGQAVAAAERKRERTREERERRNGER